VSETWRLLIYRLPGGESARARVAVWRELRRLGALPLQQGVAAAPELGDLGDRLDGVEARITAEGGTFYRFRLDALSDAERSRLEADWNALREQEYAEIVEECETKFAREIEFEIFRGNLTAGEAEEIEADLDKIKAWYGRIRARDWYQAASRRDAEDAIARSEALLEDFVDRVYRAEAEAGPSLDPPLDLPWGTSELPTRAEEGA
jgi:hypothetical protein